MCCKVGERQGVFGIQDYIFILLFSSFCYDRKGGGRDGGGEREERLTSVESETRNRLGEAKYDWNGNIKL